MIDITDKCQINGQQIIDKSIKRDGVITGSYLKSFITVTLDESHHYLLKEVVLINGRKCFSVSNCVSGYCRFEIVD